VFFSGLSKKIAFNEHNKHIIADTSIILEEVFSFKAKITNLFNISILIQPKIIHITIIDCKKIKTENNVNITLSNFFILNFILSLARFFLTLFLDFHLLFVDFLLLFLLLSFLYLHLEHEH